MTFNFPYGDIKFIGSGESATPGINDLDFIVMSNANQDITCNAPIKITNKNDFNTDAALHIINKDLTETTGGRPTSINFFGTDLAENQIETGNFEFNNYGNNDSIFKLNLRSNGILDTFMNINTYTNQFNLYNTLNISTENQNPLMIF